MPSRAALIQLLAAFCLASASAAFAQCPPSVPARGAALPGPLPLFPADNWWNADISAAPVDAKSAGYIAFINNGGTRRLHPDFGGVASSDGNSIFGMPYAVVDGAQPKLPVTFQYADESDGQGIAFYPIPAEAIAQSQWIEGGAPGNVDQRDESDRHLLIVDCTNRHLYELYNVYYAASEGRWHAGSGAFFDTNANHRRPDTWTSADAAGLAILPGLIRYDEAWNPAIAEIGHAFRVTVRSTNGYVYPASHSAGGTASALPMGARLRLRASVSGADPALRTSDPNVRKVFRAMQKHGLIVADNGSDLYITGTFDTRWNNDILNPAFALLSASDFEVIELGWKPSAAATALVSLEVLPATIVGGGSFFALVTLSGPAPPGGTSVALSSSNPALVIAPSGVDIPAGTTMGKVLLVTRPTRSGAIVALTATAGGVARSATIEVRLR